MKFGNKQSLALFIAAMAGSSCVFAGVTPPACQDPWQQGDGTWCTATITPGGADSRRDHKIYTGINWKFDGKGTPELVFGYQNLKVKSNKHANGGRVEFTLPIQDGIKPGALKLSVVAGKTHLLGLLGAGYQFGDGFLLTGGLQLPHLTGGIDYLPGQPIKPYLGVSTLGRSKTPTGGISTCPAMPADTADYDYQSVFTDSPTLCILEYATPD